jgi:hypothetical protein
MEHGDVEAANTAAPHREAGQPRRGNQTVAGERLASLPVIVKELKLRHGSSESSRLKRTLHLSRSAQHTN